MQGITYFEFKDGVISPAQNLTDADIVVVADASALTMFKNMLRIENYDKGIEISKPWVWYYLHNDNPYDLTEGFVLVDEYIDELQVLLSDLQNIKSNFG